MDPTQDGQCYECGAVMTMQPYSNVTQIGPYSITDDTECVLTCPCGEQLFHCRQIQRYELRAAARVMREHPDAPGSVVRYARKAIGMRHVDFAAMLGVAADEVVVWEISNTGLHPEYRAAILSKIDAKLREF